MKYRFLFVALSILTALGPIVFVFVMYQNHLPSLIIPPQIQNILKGSGQGNNETNGNSSPGPTGISDGLFTGQPFELPQVVSVLPVSNADSDIVVLNFTNPVNYDLNLNSFSSGVVDTQDGYPIGQVSLVKPVAIPTGATSDIPLLCQWTQDGKNHLETEYPNGTNIKISLLKPKFDLSGVTIQAPISYPLNFSLPYGG